MLHKLDQSLPEGYEPFHDHADERPRLPTGGLFGAGDSAAVYPEERLEMFGEILKDKGRAEENLIASGLDYTIIRNFRLLSETVPVTGRAYLTDDQMALGGIGRADLGVLNVYCIDGYLCENKIFHAITPE